MVSPNVHQVIKGDVDTPSVCVYVGECVSVYLCVYEYVFSVFMCIGKGKDREIGRQK